jgi:uncharacterized membrane protein HdeD (DUF308 family)
MAGRDLGAEAARVWWIYLIPAGAWLLFSIIVFRFDWSSVNSIAILFGIVLLGAAVNELLNAMRAHGGWRFAHGALAVVFGILGILSFIHPGDTFEALAAIISFYFIFKGFFDIVLAFFQRHEVDLWWLRLLLGVAEVLIGFWAAGDFGHQAILLVVFVGVAALTRGITEILFAFSLRRAG